MRNATARARRLAMVEINPSVILGLDGIVRVDNPIDEDARIVGSYVDYERGGVLRLLVEAEEFGGVQEGDIIPDGPRIVLENLPSGKPISDGRNYFRAVRHMIGRLQRADHPLARTILSEFDAIRGTDWPEVDR